MLKKSVNFIDDKLPCDLTQDQLLKKATQLLTPHIRRQLERQAPSTHRATLRILVLIVISTHFVLARFRSFSEVFGALRRTGLWFIPPINVSNSALFKRFSFFSCEAFIWLIRTLAPLVQKQAETFAKSHPAARLAPFADDVYCMDESVLDQIARKYFVRELPPKGTKELDSNPGRICALFNICSGLIHNVGFYDDPGENEKRHAREIAQELPAGGLLLFDLGYFAFPWFDWLTERFTFFISRMRKRTSYEVLHVFVDNELVRDRVIYLGKWKEKAAYPVRFVELYLEGEWWGYITNVLEPSMLPAHHLFMLYSQRWTIERLFFVLKEVLGLNRLRLCHLQGVKWQIWATVFGFQVAQSLRLELASKLEVEVDDLSWEHFFRGIECYYREAAGRTDKDVLDWMVLHHESLNLLKKKRKPERKVNGLPKGVEKSYTRRFAPLPEEICPREAENTGRRGGRREDREATEYHRKVLIGTSPRKRGKRKPRKNRKRN